MKSTLVDAGPLIAAFNGGDAHHARVMTFLRGWNGQLITTWPALTEASHLLGFSVTAQLNLLRWIERGGLIVADLAANAVADMISYTEKYQDRPMDLADASLVALAMQSGIKSIATIDSDFEIYRLPNKTKLRNVLKP
jgi:uncharacterized protein